MRESSYSTGPNGNNPHSYGAAYPSADEVQKFGNTLRPAVTAAVEAGREVCPKKSKLAKCCLRETIFVNDSAGGVTVEFAYDDRYRPCRNEQTSLPAMTALDHFEEAAKGIGIVIKHEY